MREIAYKLHVCSQSGRHLLFFIILFFISAPASERKNDCLCARERAKNRFNCSQCSIMEYNAPTGLAWLGWLPLRKLL